MKYTTKLGDASLKISNDTQQIRQVISRRLTVIAEALTLESANTQPDMTLLASSASALAALVDLHIASTKSWIATEEVIDPWQRPRAKKYM